LFHFSPAIERSIPAIAVPAQFQYHELAKGNIMIVGFGELILLVAIGGAGNNELVSLVDAQAYFKHHNVTVNAASMEKLAATDPADAKAQISQLLAIGWLGEHADEAKGARATLEAIADGKKAQDPTGFARSHAARALARLDGKAPPKSAALPEGSLREAAYRAFPDDVTLLGGIDLRASGSMKIEGNPLHLITAGMPQKDQKELFEYVDKIGNFRVDRISFALHVPKDAEEPDQMYVHIQGAGNLSRLRDLVGTLLKDAKKTVRKDDRGPTITTLASESQAPAIAFIDNADSQEVLLASYAKNKGKHIELLERALSVRDGDKPSALKGAQADLLKEVPAHAYFALAGELSDPMRKGLAEHLTKVAPKRIVLSARRDKEILLEARGIMVDDAETDQMLEAFAALRKHALDFLDNPPPQAHLTKEGRDAIVSAIKGVDVNAKDKTVIVSAKISAEVVQTLFGWVKQQLAAERERDDR
jgi:hypothetical protein